MKTIIAGSRDCSREETLQAINDSGIADQITEVICGDARGADTFGAEWAASKGIPVSHFPAEWKKYGKAAGPIRNRQMAEHAEALIAVCKKRSRGTTNMIDTGWQYQLLVIPFYLD